MSASEIQMDAGESRESSLNRVSSSYPSVPSSPAYSPRSSPDSATAHPPFGTPPFPAPGPSLFIFYFLVGLSILLSAYSTSHSALLGSMDVCKFCSTPWSCFVLLRTVAHWTASTRSGPSRSLEFVKRYERSRPSRRGLGPPYPRSQTIRHRETRPRSPPR